MTGLRLMLITNNPEVAKIADDVGVDWVFIDLEKIGKEVRQSGLDTVKSMHHVTDIPAVKSSLTNARLVVRVNPLGLHSRREIDEVIKAGADIVMLPYFKSTQEAEDFIDHVAHRAETCLLVETMEAVDAIEETILLDGIDYIHIGLNDIHLQRGTKFMFEFLSDGSMDQLAGKIQDKHIPFGFGGVGRTNEMKPTGARILGEHLRLGSTGVILSRSFINIDAFDGLEDFAISLRDGVNDIRECLEQLETAPDDYFEENRRICAQEIMEVAATMKHKDPS